jgi:hypothetical protein
MPPSLIRSQEDATFHGDSVDIIRETTGTRPGQYTASIPEFDKSLATVLMVTVRAVSTDVHLMK